MSKYLLKAVLHDGKQRDILIVDNKFSKISAEIPAAEYPDSAVIDCHGLAIVPPFYNGHCHSAMTLLRGFADDLPLFDWLNDHIWPAEAKLTDDMIKIGSQLAIIEMIKSGTVFFNDMYWGQEATIEAIEQFGVRACIGACYTNDDKTNGGWERKLKWLQKPVPASGRVQKAVMPHAIYTADRELILRCWDYAKENDLLFHMHLAETAKEVEDCRNEHGCTPVEYLDRLGVLGPKTILAHCVHLTDNDRRILASSGSVVVLNLVSNFKLSSGVIELPKLLDAGVRVIVGTDGASSNNNLDMHEEMKLAAILAKVQGGASCLPAAAALDMATRAGAQAFGIDGGCIVEGALADCLLINLDNERLVPNYNLLSNWVYAADSRAIDTVICDGRIIMQKGHISGEEAVIAAARECCKAIS